MIIPILLGTMMVLTKGKGDPVQYCSPEVPLINTTAGSLRDPKFDSLIMRKVSRTSIPKTIQHTVVEVEREYQRCKPKIIKEEYSECRPAVEKQQYDSELVEKMVEKQQCLVGESCQEYECRGDKSSFCVEPRLIHWVNAQKRVSVLKATSLLFDTCMQSWGCKIKKVLSQTYFNAAAMTIKSPLHGTFVHRPDQKVSWDPDRGAYSVITGKWDISEEEIIVSCISSKSGEDMCNDKSTGLFFPFSRGITCLENACFQFKEGKTSTVAVDENLNAGRVTDLLDLDKLYRISQFQSLQTSLNFQRVYSQLSEVESLISQFILTMDSSNRDNLFSNLLGRDVRVMPQANGMLKIAVCKSPEKLSPHDQAGRGSKTEGHLRVNNKGNFQLFHQEGLLRTEVPEPSFKIDSLTYQELFELIEKERMFRERDSKAPDMGSSASWWERIKASVREIGAYFGFVMMLFALGASWCIIWMNFVKVRTQSV
nr:MAG: hypothetical protein [Wuhan Mosquito Virus 6]